MIVLRMMRLPSASGHEQAANGVLLPIVAVFLLIVVNRRSLLREHTNGTVANVLGALVVLVAAGLGAVQIGKVLATIFS